MLRTKRWPTKSPMETPSSAFQADVTNLDQAKDLVKQVKEKFGRIDILVNNAGITRDKLLLMMSEKDWDDVIDTNLKGVFNLTKPVVGVMLRQRSGTILNITFDQRNRRNGRTGELFVIEGGHDRLHQSARQRNRKSQHHGECTCPGFRRNRHDRRAE